MGDTVKLPDLWKTNFLNQTFKRTFQLRLTQPMLEMLCAISDGVQWSRSVHSPDIHAPDCSVPTGRHLENRGLVEHYQRWDEKSQKQYQKKSAKVFSNEARQGEHLAMTCWRLTPAGEALVELLKVVGLFVESDATTYKRPRRKTSKSRRKRG